MKIGFIGAGLMAEAIIGGMLDGGFSQVEVLASDLDVKRREYIVEKYGIRVEEDNQTLAGLCDVLIVAVKPQYFPKAAKELCPALRSGHKIISIMAGITTVQLENDLRAVSDSDAILSVVRVMPNMPAMARAGVTCLCAGSRAADADVALTRRIFSMVGSVTDVSEPLIDAATGVAGCGPAYLYMIIEAMADGGVLMGLPRPLAQLLAAEAVKGSAEMVLAGFGHPGQLKDNVCSPGGATIEGVYSLERSGLRGAMMEAVRAGAEKCKHIQQ